MRVPVIGNTGRCAPITPNRPRTVSLHKEPGVPRPSHYLPNRRGLIVTSADRAQIQGSIPLSDLGTPAQASIGDLVKDATVHASTLVRSEIELAKTEITGEVKKGLQGSVFFILALVVLLFSTFFFFFFAAELLDVWLPRWSAFLIVFVVMVLVAALSALLGWRRVRKLRAPEKTIASLKETAGAFGSNSSTLPGGAAAPEMVSDAPRAS